MSFNGSIYRVAAPLMQISARREPVGPAREAGWRSNAAPPDSTLWRKIPEGGSPLSQIFMPQMTAMVRALELQLVFPRSQSVNKQAIKTWRRRMGALKKRNHSHPEAGNISR
jgi:hypothetical protein